MDNEISDSLEKLIDDLPRNLKSCMANACAKVANEAKERAPKGETGNLKRGISFDVNEDGAEGVVYSPEEYAPYVECGTGIYATKGSGRKTPWRYEGSHGRVTTKGNKAQPFLEPAFNATRSDIIDSFKEVLG